MSSAGAPAPPFDPPPGPDERTRQRLLRAAVGVFVRKGYAATSVREIAALAGVTKPALYYHFGSKEGLLVAILEEGLRRLRPATDAGLRRGGSTRDRLAALTRDVCALLRSHLPVVRVAHALATGPVEAAPPFEFAIFDRTLHQAVVRILDDGRRAGEVGPGSIEAAAIAISGVIAACTARDLHRSGAADGVPVERVLNCVLDGILRTPPISGVPPS